MNGKTLPASYVTGRTNYCPGCGRSQWWIGRTTAECAFCHTAVPISGATSSMTGRKEVIKRK